ncbi:hypothetical protein STEG23_034694, partial [Scotinomys teguina]
IEKSQLSFEPSYPEARGYKAKTMAKSAFNCPRKPLKQADNDKVSHEYQQNMAYQVEDVNSPIAQCIHTVFINHLLATAMVNIACQLGLNQGSSSHVCDVTSQKDYLRMNHSPLEWTSPSNCSLDGYKKFWWEKRGSSLPVFTSNCYFHELLHSIHKLNCITDMYVQYRIKLSSSFHDIVVSGDVSPKDEGLSDPAMFDKQLRTYGGKVRAARGTQQHLSLYAVEPVGLMLLREISNSKSGLFEERVCL